MSEDTKRTDKPPSLDRLSVLWRRVNDHKMVQWSVAYVALAYGIQHGVVLTSEAFDWPHAVTGISMLLLALGLPVVMTLAWYHGACASRRISGPELTIISILLVMSSLLFYVFVRPSEEIATGPKAAVQQVSVAAGTVTSAGISIAVLPFVNLSGDAGQEFFSDGMTEEMTASLAKVPDLHVVGRSSAFQFKGQSKDLRAVGQALGASHLIEGSVRKAGDRVRITAELVRADNGLQLWTESYDRQITDIFATQEDIAQAIAAALKLPLGLQQGETLVRNRTKDDASYEDYLRARALVRARGYDRLVEAAKLLEQVVARDPNFAPAWAQLALAYMYLPVNHVAYLGGAFGELRPIFEISRTKAEAAAQRAIQLDPKSPEGFLALGGVQGFQEKYSEAQNMYERALALDPDNPEVLYVNCLVLADLGFIKQALPLAQRLRALEPFVPIYNAIAATVLWASGQTDEAIAILKPLATSGSGLGNPAYGLARIYAAQGRYSEAADALQSMPAGTYPPGMAEAAVRLMRSAPAPASPQTLPKLANLAFVYAYVGAGDRVLDYRENAHRNGFWTALYYYWAQPYQNIRKTSRFKALMRDAGYLEYWRARGWPDLCHPTNGDNFECN